MFSGLLMLLMASPTLEIDCGRDLSRIIQRLPGPALLRLAPGCSYEGPVQIKRDKSLAIVGSPGTVIKGPLVLNDAGALSLRNLRIESETVAIIATRASALTLDAVVLQAQDGLHIRDSGPILVRRGLFLTPGNGIWIEESSSLSLLESQMEAPQLLLMAQNVREVELRECRFRVASEISTKAALYVRGGEVQFYGNHFELISKEEGHVIVDLDAQGFIAENRFLGTGTGIRSKRRVKLGCNQFQRSLVSTSGRFKRACERDIAPDSLRPRLAWSG